MFIQNYTTVSGEIFVSDTSGFTSKTFLITLILSKIKGDEKIALDKTSSGIATTPLPRGNTTYFMFKVPITMDKTESSLQYLKNNDKNESFKRLHTYY